MSAVEWLIVGLLAAALGGGVAFAIRRRSAGPEAALRELAARNGLEIDEDLHVHGKIELVRVSVRVGETATEWIGEILCIEGFEVASPRLVSLLPEKEGAEVITLGDADFDAVLAVRATDVEEARRALAFDGLRRSLGQLGSLCDDVLGAEGRVRARLNGPPPNLDTLQRVLDQVVGTIRGSYEAAATDN